MGWQGGCSPARTPVGTGSLKLRHLAAHYGPPEIAALARPEQLPRPPRHRQD
jgi:hypothetical protein